MEKLKEEIRKALYDSAVITQAREGVSMSFTFDKQAEAVMKIVEPLLEADRIVRWLAESENMSERLQLSIVAQHYVKANPNKEGGEGE